MQLELTQLRFAVSRTNVSSFSPFRLVSVVCADFLVMPLQEMEDRMIELEAMKKVLEEGLGLEFS